MKTKRLSVFAVLVIVGGMTLAACGTVHHPTTTRKLHVNLPHAVSNQRLPKLDAVESAYVSYMEKALNIDPKKVSLNEAPPMENGVQNFLDHPSDAAEASIYATQPSNWVFSGGWLSVRSLYAVNPNPVVSIQLYAKAMAHGLPHREIAQIRKSPQIYVDFGFSKNHKDVSYLIWWEN